MSPDELREINPAASTIRSHAARLPQPVLDQIDT
jgi:hypothetical protein